MIVKFVRDWRNKRTGQVVDYADGYADALIRRRIAEPIRERPPQHQPKRRRA